MSYTPSPTIRQMYGNERWEGAEQDLDNLFFERLRPRDGVFKTTARRRLDDVNKRILSLLPRQRTVQLMDVAISSGIATLEWVQQLKEEGIHFEMTAGDAVLNTYLLTLGAFSAIIDRDGYPLQIDLGSLALPNASGSRWRHALFRISRLLLWLPLPWRKSPLQLVNPALLRQSSQITLIEDDIAVANPALVGRFDVIRAANILNRVYFDDAKLAKMVDNLSERLVVGGLLVVCRTGADGGNHGTIFRREADGSLSVVQRFGDGSDVDCLLAAAG